MEKMNEKSYTSQKLLGHLFRRAHGVASAVDLAAVDLNDYNPVSGPVIEEARQVAAQYERNVRALLLSFGLRSEAELALALTFEADAAGDRGAASRAVRAAFDALQEDYRDRFFELPDGGRLPEAAWRDRALAWFAASYEPRRKAIRSLAWVVGDVLFLADSNSMSTLLGRDFS